MSLNKTNFPFFTASMTRILYKLCNIWSLNLALQLHIYIYIYAIVSITMTYGHKPLTRLTIPADKGNSCHSATSFLPIMLSRHPDAFHLLTSAYACVISPEDLHNHTQCTVVMTMVSIAPRAGFEPTLLAILEPAC